MGAVKMEYTIDRQVVETVGAVLRIVVAQRSVGQYNLCRQGRPRAFSDGIRFRQRDAAADRSLGAKTG